SLSDSAIQPLDSEVGLLGVDEMLRPMYSNQTGPFQGPAVGTAHFRDTTKINRHLALARERNIFNSDVRFIWSALPESDPDTRKPTDRFTLYAIQVRSRDGKPPLGGEVVVSASQQFDEASGNAYVLMNMNSEGTRIWSQLTQINEGKSIAVVMDNRVY